jgi:hypothetical protein
MPEKISVLLKRTFPRVMPALDPSISGEMTLRSLAR